MLGSPALPLLNVQIFFHSEIPLCCILQQRERDNKSLFFLGSVSRTASLQGDATDGNRTIVSVAHLKNVSSKEEKKMLHTHTTSVAMCIS